MQGRPKQEIVRDRMFHVRLTDEEGQMLAYIAESTRQTKSEVIRALLIRDYNRRIRC